MGDVIRLTTESTGFRISDIYRSVSLPAGTLCRVARQEHGDWSRVWRAAPLKYVKSKQEWVERPVLVAILSKPEIPPVSHPWEFAEL